MVARLLQRVWGGIKAGERPMPTAWVDALLAAGVIALIYGAYHVASEWHEPARRVVEIDLRWRALPWYAFLSLSRGLIAYVVSLLFTLAYGYWAAKDRHAERVLIPLLDILQSIPVLGFMPGLVIALVALFPHSNVGLELAAVLMIFTGQVWNMTFGWYQSLRAVPNDLKEAATIFRFSWWRRFRQIELPSGMLGLIWNSMMSMAGGWFFLMVNEAFRLGDEDYRLPGLGSYMSEAVAQRRPAAMLGGVIAMVVMIVVLDQLLWRPLVAWGQKFRVEETASSETTTSWFLDWLRRSRLVRSIARAMASLRAWKPRAPTHEEEQLMTSEPASEAMRPTHRVRSAIGLLPLIGLVGLMGWCGVELIGLVRHLSAAQWVMLAGTAGLTCARVFAATILGTLWTVPAGLAIGLSPRLSRAVQPIVQVAASFPAPMVFPLVVLALDHIGIGLGVGSVALMLLGTQWYVLFNVVAGAMTIPADLRGAFKVYGVTGWQRMRLLYLPGIFPYLVTGWVTAVGGAWNASIVSEYVSYGDHPRTTAGLGAVISQAAEARDLPLLAAGVVVMSTAVVGINRLLWRRLYHLGQTRFARDM